MPRVEGRASCPVVMRSAPPHRGRPPRRRYADIESVAGSPCRTAGQSSMKIRVFGDAVPSVCEQVMRLRFRRAPVRAASCLHRIAEHALTAATWFDSATRTPPSGSTWIARMFQVVETHWTLSLVCVGNLPVGPAAGRGHLECRDCALRLRLRDQPGAAQAGSGRSPAAGATAAGRRRSVQRCARKSRTAHVFPH